jgi:hypothetical protein
MPKSIFLIFTILFSSPTFSQIEQKTPTEPSTEVERLMENMAIDEKYCTGVATLGYAIDTLKRQGESSLATAKKIQSELSSNFPDEDPRYLASIVSLLTIDHFKNHSVSLNTLMGWHYFMCIHSIRSGSGFLLQSTGVDENTNALLDCEFPGKDTASCVSSIYIGWLKGK